MLWKVKGMNANFLKIKKSEKEKRKKKEKRLYEWQSEFTFLLLRELSGSCVNMILHSNRMTKHGYSYTTYDLIRDDGKFIVFGLWKVGAAVANS